MDLGWKSIVLVSCGAVGGLLSLGIGPSVAAPGADATKVTLTRRANGGPYGTSAYSFRHASQELAIHHNFVDLVLNNCGRVHLDADSGQKSRLTRVPGKKLADVAALPADGWLEGCFQPEKDALYVLDVSDGTTHYPVKLRVLEAKPDKVTFEWAPLIVDGDLGVLGTCGGEHDCR